MKLQHFILAFCITAILASCNGSKTDNENNTSGSKEIEFTISGNKLMMQVPDTLKAQPEIKEQSWGATEITIGKGFQISVSEINGDVTLMKKDIAENDVNKFKRYITDEPALLFWESEIVNPEFHFYAVQKTDKSIYTIEDIKGDFFSEQAVKAMVEASKTIKSK
jgi:hypothetical protein